MVYSKRLNVKKFHLEGTPRKVSYHRESGLRLVMRTELGSESLSSDVCCVDILSGSVLSSFRLASGEIGESMELVRVGNEQVLVIGTSMSDLMMSGGGGERAYGHLLVLRLEDKRNSDRSKVGSSSQQTSLFREGDNSYDVIKFEETYSVTCFERILDVCPYSRDGYFLTSEGRELCVYCFVNDDPYQVERLAAARTNFLIITLSNHKQLVAAGAHSEGILYFVYDEAEKELILTFGILHRGW